MNSQFKECTEKLRKLVSEVQGAPYPNAVNSELYSIWYEHIQNAALECFEFLSENMPPEKTNFTKDLKEFL
ncbi:MAG: hypothetical protein LBU99_02635 [Spirochaetaceae bacterium]|jgi:hypothetical protein|nr:hypothetical protein [Spirochaetaceae bacterium]